MKRIIALILSACALFLTACTGGKITDIRLRPESPGLIIPKKEGEVCGVWFSFLDFEEIFYGMDKASFEEKLKEVIHNCNTFGINTIFLHVRAHGDAFYNSKYYPKTTRLGEIDYDILETAIKLCHESGIQVHAWINPLRLQKDFEGISDEYITKKWYKENNGTYVVDVDGRYYLNPAYPETRELVINGVKEIVENYDVDGIHFDDYFYPTTAEAFDKQAFSESGKQSLSEFRLENINTLVKGVYDAIGGKTVFSISPQGNIENNYATQYADVKKWCSESGYIDWIIPQLYYGFKNSKSPFYATAKQWQELITADNIKMLGGLAAYKIGTIDEYAGESGRTEWQSGGGIIANQIKSIRIQKNSCGVVLYRYNSIFSPAEEVKASMKTEIAAMVPLLK